MAGVGDNGERYCEKEFSFSRIDVFQLSKYLKLLNFLTQDKSYIKLM